MVSFKGTDLQWISGILQGRRVETEGLGLIVALCEILTGIAFMIVCLR